MRVRESNINQEAASLACEDGPIYWFLPLLHKLIECGLGCREGNTNEEVATAKLRTLYELEMIKFSKDILLPLDTIVEILQNIEPSGSRIGQIIDQVGVMLHSGLEQSVFFISLA